MSINNNTYSFNKFKENIKTLPKGKIEGKISERNFFNEIFLIRSNLNIHENSIVQANTNNIDGIVMNFIFNGLGSYSSEINDLKFNTFSDYSNILLIKDNIGKSFAHKGDIDSVSLVIKKSYLDRILPQKSLKEDILNPLEKNVCSKILSNRKMSHQSKLILKDIISTPFDENFNSIYIQGKILELISLNFNETFVSTKVEKDDFKLDDHDINAIKKAKEILIQNMQNPPSLFELSRLAGINDFKLKKGFKKLYGTSAYDFLLNYRLNLARELLLKGEMNISEIAFYIGYKYVQSFSTKFTKKYGTTPSSLLKSRKYY